MAMNLGMNTKKLFIGSTLNVTNAQYDDGFNTQGVWSGGNIKNGSTNVALNESHYLDLGIITDEREELTNGGIAISIPTRGVQDRIFWGIGGKVLRITISGIIPDGEYVDIIGGGLNGMSNVSVFKYKLNKLIGYLAADLGDNKFPNVVQYRRTYIEERISQYEDTTQLAKFVITGYSTAFINGTRNLSYTISLDLSNNLEPSRSLKDFINVKAFGDL